MVRQVVALHIGEEVYGVDIAAINTVLTPQPITSMPNLPPYIKGVINLRGRILPVLDLRARFGIEPLSEDRRSHCRVVILEVGLLCAGLIVDSVSEVLRIHEDSIEAPCDLLDSGDRRYITGIGKISRQGGQSSGHDDDLIVLLGVEELLEPIAEHAAG